MSDLNSLGRVIIGLGLVLVIIGLFVLFADRVPGLNRLGQLPGDIVIERGNTRIYIPIVTSLLVSVLLTLVLWLFSRR